MAHQICNNICIKYKALNTDVTLGRYNQGQKHCVHCNIYVYYDGLFCPCCTTRLRTRPRNMNYKNKHLAKLNVKRIS